EEYIMKSKYIKIIAGVTALALSSGFTVLYAESRNEEPETEETSEVQARSEETQQTEDNSRSTQNGDALTKNETVYVNASADGNTEDVTVSDWISNPDSLQILNDVSNLSDIVNVKGSEAYSETGNGLMWQAGGSDIYYQGKTDRDLPVKLSVTYTLDGDKVTPAELAGKSGHVTIRFDYTNTEKRTIDVDGKKYTVSVPFAAVTGLVLDSSKFSNVEAVNGKVVSDGNRCICAGGAFPGLKESLETGRQTEDPAIDTSMINIPEYFEVSADVTDFSLETSVTVVTNDIFSELGIDPTSTVDELKSKIDELTEASLKLKNGTSDLYDGISTLLEKSKDLKSGVGKLSDGASKLNDAAGQINDGAAKLSEGAGKLNEGGVKLDDGIGEFADGIDSLKEGTGALKDGAGSLKEGTAALSEGAASLKNGTAALSEGAASLKEGTSSLSAGAAELSGGAKTLSDGTVSLDSGVEDLGNGHAKGKEVSAKTAVTGVSVPFHPGTVKYYKEIGLMN
ncbi:MAG: hypothetical protein J5780_00335, partial [Treponema sp.]|nr:hypothetical protein [Treponema sp.]